MSRVQSIPRAHWATYLKAVSRRFLEQPVELDLEGHGDADRPIAHGLYFMGASLEGGHRPAVILQLAPLGHPEARLSHRIPSPALILRELDAEGQLARLVFEDDAKRRTALVMADTTPSPGARRRPSQRASERCDHPRCPVAPA
jgi:hypothetical protein